MGFEKNFDSRFGQTGFPRYSWGLLTFLINLEPQTVLGIIYAKKSSFPSLFAAFGDRLIESSNSQNHKY